MVKHQARKRFGQHFLHDKRVIERLLEAIAPQPDQLIVEIGPGRGALTLPLLRRVGRLEAIEVDRDLAAYVRQKGNAEGELQVHSTDALVFDFLALSREKGQRLRMVGNLPYNISTPLLFHLFAQIEAIENMHFMLQREVAVRLGSMPGTKDYGRLSVMAQFYCTINLLFAVKPGAFIPPPKVDSMVVCLQPRRPRLAPEIPRAALYQVVARAFSQRRKTLGNALKGLLARTDLQAAGLDPQQRPETVTLEQYLALTQVWLARK